MSWAHFLQAVFKLHCNKSLQEMELNVITEASFNSIVLEDSNIT